MKLDIYIDYVEIIFHIKERQLLHIYFLNYLPLFFVFAPLLYSQTPWFKHIYFRINIK